MARYARVKNQTPFNKFCEKINTERLISGTIYHTACAPADAIPHTLPRLRTKRRAKLEAHTAKYNL